MSTNQWWHLYGKMHESGDLEGCYQTVMAGPTEITVDEPRAGKPTLRETDLDGCTYLASFDHEPSEWEKDQARAPEHRDLMKVSLTVENTYELYEDETRVYTDVVVNRPSPEDLADDLEEWRKSELEEYCGVGHEDGDSWYDMEVTASSEPDLVPVGRTFDWGY